MTRNFTRIMVPTDFSAPSNAALVLAKRMATTSGASLHLLHVLEDPSAVPAYATDFYAAPPAGMTESWLKGAEGLLDTQLTPDEQIFFRRTQEVRFGAPARTSSIMRQRTTSTLS
jgi:nucleotide-binding universal stress UspA family protein